MKVFVEPCWSGNINYSFRFTVETGRYKGARWHLTGDEWSRKMATEARDYIERHFRIKRNSIKFVHY